MARRKAQPAQRRRGLLGRAASALSAACALGALAVAAAWLAGAILSDRWLWSQYLSWIPAELAALACWAAAAVVAAAGLGRRRAPRLRLAACLLPAASLSALVLLVEWRAHRLLGIDRPPPAGPAEREIGVVFANIASGAREPDGLRRSLRALLEPAPDILVLANSWSWFFDEQYEPSQNEVSLAVSGRPVASVRDRTPHRLHLGGFDVFTSLPIRRWARAWVPTLQDWTGSPAHRQRHSGLLLLELDGPAGPLTLWVVDLPSSPGLARAEVMRAARAAAIGVQSVNVRVLAETGRAVWRPEQIEPGDPLFRPDVLVGDVNVPRTAWSLGLLAPGLRDAHAEAGRGCPATFPSRAPVLPIDVVRVGGSLRALSLEREPVPAVRHLGLRARLAVPVKSVDPAGPPADDGQQASGPRPDRPVRQGPAPGESP